MIIIENKETGETKEIAPGEHFRLPWKVKGTVANIKRKEEKQQRNTYIKSRLAVAATKLGVPVPKLFDLVRQVAGIKCPYCDLSTKILEHLDRLGDEKACNILQRVLIAKEKDDRMELNRLVKEFLYAKQVD